MKILKKAQREQGFEYEVLRSFTFKIDGDIRTLKVGETMNIPPEQEGDGFGLVSAGKLKPRLPKIAKYEALRDFTFRLGDEKLEIKRHEIVEMAADDALPEILRRNIHPCDKDVWTRFRKVREKKHPADGAPEYYSKIPFPQAWMFDSSGKLKPEYGGFGKNGKLGGN